MDREEKKMRRKTMKVRQRTEEKERTSGRERQQYVRHKGEERKGKNRD